MEATNPISITEDVLVSRLFKKDQLAFSYHYDNYAPALNGVIYRIVQELLNNKESNFPEAFKFNIKANDGYLLLRIPQRETNNNKGIPESANNNEGSQPVSGDNATLRDGITD